MAPFDRPIAYQSASVSIALSCTILEIFDVKEYNDLEMQVKCHSLCEFMQNSVRR